MAKREFLQLAHTYNASKHGIGGLWYSKKMDGMRAFWDGGISRGIPKSEVPWANTAKDYRYIKKQIATGLWSRYGHVVYAPDWWLDKMPNFPLDGELWNPNFARQDIMSIVKKQEPTSKWMYIRLYVYDSPPLATIFKDGKINNINFKKEIVESEIHNWIESRNWIYRDIPAPQTVFRSIYNQLKNILVEENVAVLHPQYELPFQTSLAQKHLDAQLLQLLPTEDGLIIRHPDKVWMPERVYSVLKVKPWDDAEGTVIGYITGRETDKGSKLLGMMGALILDFNGKRLELSGFTEDERKLVVCIGSSAGENGDAKNWAIKHPEKECPDWIEAVDFPRGSVVTFKYRGLSNDGIPQEARYWRKY